MANNLTVISNNLPAYLQGGQVGYQDTGLAAGVTPKAPKLAVTTAKQWTVTKDGQQMILPTPTVKAVLLASAMNITKAWYAKAYTPGSTEAPDCYSDDGRTPAAGVKAPQCSNCAQCPKNAFGSHPVTGRGKACGDRKRVVLVWEGLPDELMTFNVPTMSLQSLLKLDNELKNANIPLQSVLVELSFDPAIAYPVVKIGAVGFVDQQTALNLIDRAGSSEVSSLLRESEYDDAPDAQPETALVPAQVVQFGLQQPAGQVQQPAEQQTGAQLPPIHGQLNTQVGGVEQQKRRRRTKAEMEAARAAEVGSHTTIPGNPGGGAAGLTATLQPQTQAMQQLVETAAVQQPQTQAPVGGLNVADLLSKWQNS